MSQIYSYHCELARELHQELLLTCATTAKLKFGGGLFAGNARDYCDGFVRGLRDKIDASHKAVKSEAPALAGPTMALSIVRATDIALAKRRKAGEWLKKEAGIKLQKTYGRGRSVNDSGAYNEGRVDGGSQSLTKSRTQRIGQ